MSPEKERPDTDNSARVLLEIKKENEDEYTGGILKSVAASRDKKSLNQSSSLGYFL